MNKEEQLEEIISSFVDSEENPYYVSLNKTRLNYSKLINSLKNPFKIMLLYGPPGSGKSFLFNRFYEEFKEKYPIFLFKTPDFNLQALLSIYNKLTNDNFQSNEANEILEKIRHFNQEIIIMLDEAQLYTPDEMEKIRLLSNEKNLKFIITVHKVSNEDILAQKHFQTRIYETIVFEDIKPKDIKQYIEEKLVSTNSSNLFLAFNNKSFALIYDYSKGNLRDLNRILHRLFSLLLYNFKNQKAFTLNSKMLNKAVHLAALDLGLINKKSWKFPWT